MATKRLSNILIFLVMVTLASNIAAGAGRCCTQCGCQQVKKVTRKDVRRMGQKYLQGRDLAGAFIGPDKIDLKPISSRRF